VRVLPKENRVVVSGINVMKRHRKADKTQTGGIVEKEMPIHASNVALFDPKQKKATRIGYTFLKDGSKVRVAKRSGETLN
jgi:large subunit ribosomal protein L24